MAAGIAPVRSGMSPRYTLDVWQFVVDENRIQLSECVLYSNAPCHTLAMYGVVILKYADVGQERYTLSVLLCAYELFRKIDKAVRRQA
jgi:hypothetical protein